MKKTTLLFITLLFSAVITAGGGWGSTPNGIMRIGLNHNPPYSYYLYEGASMSFLNKDFSTPNKLMLDGARSGSNNWVTEGDYLNGTSFTTYYRVYKEGTTPGEWKSFPMPESYAGSTVNFHNTGLDINILALATENGVQIFEVAMSKKRYGSDNSLVAFSMIPGGGADTLAYDAANPGYKAKFTIAPPRSVFTSYMTIGGGELGTWYNGSGEDQTELFNGANLGEFSNEILLGGQAKCYPNTRTDAILWYKIDDGESKQILLPYKELTPNGNNTGFDSQHYGEQAIDISSLAEGNHTLAVWFQPAEGVEKYDNNSGANFIATFSRVKTGLDQVAASLRINTTENAVNASFDGKANIRIYSVTGQLIHSETAENSFRKELSKGIYLFKLNNASRKIIIN